MVATTVFVPASITDTVFAAPLSTYTVCVAGFIAIP